MAYESTTDNFQIRNANKVTFVGTSNTMVDTTTGRIQTKGFQHNSNVITDISGPHGRVAPTLKKYPEIIFEDGKFDANDSTNTYVQAGYTVTASSQASQITRNPWSAFDDVDLTHQEFAYTMNLYDGSDGTNPGFATTNAALTTNVDGSGTYRGEWLQLQLPNKIKINKYVLGKRAHQFGGLITKEGKILASNDGINWTTIYDHNDTGDLYSVSTTSIERRTFQVNSSSYYNYFRLATNKLFPTGLGTGTTMTPNIAVWELYGTEEYTPAGDHSVDTTFMSRFNNPQLTGVQVLVDGATGLGTNQISGGVDPSGNNETYDATNKYWTLNGTLTSNLSVEANTFFEGDQPHAVSVWFNSSNLEANVSNTCVFSISDQEKLDSDNLTLQSNTWHNLTYTYQGEGGSKVTYLDGVKVVEGITDTFGDYPPFAMTGYSQGGYVVSQSSVAPSSGREAWKTFDNDNTTHFEGNWNSAHYEANTGNVDGDQATTTNVDGSGTYQGEWIQIEFPHKIVTSYYELSNRVNFGYRMPQNAKLLGSNDGISWTTVYNHSDTGGVYTSAGETRSFGVGSNRAYKYYRLVTNKLFTNTSSSASDTPNIATWKIYGHRENDLVRLPDPTNVLKYPHVALTGPAQRGYVVTASSNHSSSSFSGKKTTNDGKPFDEDASTFWHAETNGTNDYRYDGTDNAYGTGSLSNFDPTGINIKGEWFNLELPHKIKISKVHIRARSGQETQAPEDFAFYGSQTNAAGSWTLIQSFTGQSPQDDGTSFYTITSNPTHYKYILMLITKTVGTTAFSVAQLQYYGTGVDSIPIQIGGGNIDKVANFRVYDKFVGEDQALEIWDAQKDAFGRAKSSMTLHKGRLGIGTTEPTSSLDVSGTFQGNSPLRFFVLTGTFPTSGNTQDVTVLPQDLINRIYNIVSMNGLTINSDGDQVNWNQNGSTTWEVDIKADVSVPQFVLSGFDASHVNISGKKWRMFIVTT